MPGDLREAQALTNQASLHLRLQLVRSAVLDLVGNLMVSNPAFGQTCLQLLVHNLLPPAPPAPAEPEQGPWRPKEEDLMIQSSVLGALIKVLGLVPTAPGGLLALMVQHMPHKMRDRNTQCLYLSAMFTVAESPPGRSIRDNLLAAAVEHMLTIDVEIRWEDIVDVPTGAYGFFVRLCFIRKLPSGAVQVPADSRVGVWVMCAELQSVGRPAGCYHSRMVHLRQQHVPLLSIILPVHVCSALVDACLVRPQHVMWSAPVMCRRGGGGRRE